MAKTRNPLIAKKPGRRERVFLSPSEAAKKLGLDADTLRHALNGTHHMHTYGGYNFRYVHPEDVTTHKPGGFAGKTHSEATKSKMSTAKDAKKRAVVGIDPVTGRIVHRFESITAGGKVFNRGQMVKALRTKTAKGLDRYYKGCVWRYASDIDLGT